MSSFDTSSNCTGVTGLKSIAWIQLLLRKIIFVLNICIEKRSQFVYNCEWNMNYFLFKQVRVRATDSGNPSQTTDADVIINVQRISAPVFQGIPYSTNVREDALNGTNIFTVRTDVPVNDVVYEIVGQPPAPYFFTIDTNGNIRVARDLRDDKNMQYTVSGYCWRISWLVVWKKIKFY